MRRNLFWLSDEQWERIKPHLPTDVRGVARVAWITEDPSFAPTSTMKALRAAGAMAAPVPIAGGEDTLRVQITVGFGTGL